MIPPLPPVWFPVQRVIRTAVQVILAAASVLAVTVIVAPQILDAISTAGRYAKTVRRRIEITPFGRDFYSTSFTPSSGFSGG